MVEQDFARQERAKYQEARTRYIQIRMSEVATDGVEGEKGAESGEVAVQKQESGESVGEDELQDSVFYSTSPCHVFRETTV